MIDIGAKNGRLHALEKVCHRSRLSANVLQAWARCVEFFIMSEENEDGQALALDPPH